MNTRHMVVGNRKEAFKSYGGWKNTIMGDGEIFSFQMKKLLIYFIHLLIHQQFD